MNAVTRIAPALAPFNAFASYEAERAHSRTLERTLSSALTLLRIECSRRELRGEDVGHIRQFIAGASL